MNEINLYAKRGICFRIVFDDKPLEGEIDNKTFIDLNIDNIIHYIEETYKLTQFSHYMYNDISKFAYVYYADSKNNEDILIHSIENKGNIPELLVGECLYVTQDIADALNKLDTCGSSSYEEGDEIYIQDKSKALLPDSDINYYLMTELVSECEDNISVNDIINFMIKPETVTVL